MAHESEHTARAQEEGKAWNLDPGTDCRTAEYRNVAGCPEVVGTAHACEERGHLPQGTVIRWKSNPPHSGAHFPTWVEESGIHESPIPRGNLVHNLEHGHVALLYNCQEGCDQEVATMRKIAEEDLEHTVLVSPDPLLAGSRFAAVAWTWIYRSDRADASTLRCFIRQHADHGPEYLPLN